MRPLAFPTSGNAAIVGKWDTAAAAANQGVFAAGLTLTGTLNHYGRLQSWMRSTASIKHYGGPGLTKDVWTHVAVTFSFDASAQTETVAFFRKRRSIQPSAATSVTTPTGISDTTGANAPMFVRGRRRATSDTLGSDGFIGDISDVRVWESGAHGSEVFMTIFSKRDCQPLRATRRSPT